MFTGSGDAGIGSVCGARACRRALVAATLVAAASAQSAAPRALPLDNLGLEHLDIIVPDTAASAQFYARIFGPRCISSRCATPCATSCCLATFQPIDRWAMSPSAQRGTAAGHRALLHAGKGLRPGGDGQHAASGRVLASPRRGPTGMWPDPDRLELQLFQPPAGLVTAAVPSPLPVERDGLVTPRGVDHVLLRVTSLEKSLPYYRLVYGTAAERPRDANGRVWFHLERNTRLGLEQVSPGQAPAIAHYAIKVAPFDRGAFDARLRDLGARVLPARGRARRRPLRRQQRHHRRSEGGAMTMRPKPSRVSVGSPNGKTARFRSSTLISH